MKKNIENRNYLPYNLQFFAEDESASVGDNTEANSEMESENSGTKDNSTEKRTYEDALAEIAAAQAEVKKLKAERDNALKRAGDATKQLRAKMTEAELQAEQQAEKDEEHKAYVADLENYKRTNEAIKRYQLQGMSSDLAEKAAKAEIDGDMDALADIQSQHTKALIKAKEAEWKASRPRVNVGDGEESSMTKEEILAIQDRDERQRQMAMHLDLFGK